jgi:hypothetical protein
MWLGYPNSISIIGDSETVCSKSCNNCPSLFYVIHALTLYIHSTFSILLTTVWAFCSDHFFVDSPEEKRMSVKKLLFVTMVIISVRLSMEHLERDVM